MQPKYIELFYNDLVSVALREIVSGYYWQGHPVEVALQVLEQQARERHLVFRTTGTTSYFRLIPIEQTMLPSKRSILIIGREKVMSALLFLMLIRGGYTVSTTSDVAEVALLSHTYRPDLIIYDLDTISLESIELCIADIPQLAMSSTRIAGLKKPFTQQKLLHEVEQIFKENGHGRDRKDIQCIDANRPSRGTRRAPIR